MSIFAKKIKSFLGLDNQVYRYNQDGSVSPMHNPTARVSLVGQSVNQNTPVQLNYSPISSGTNNGPNNTFNLISGCEVTANQIQFNNPGIYRIDCNFSFALQGNGARQNILTQIFVNGNLLIQKSGSNYLRNASGHNVTGDSISELIKVDSTAIVTIFQGRQAAAGTINLQGPNNSSILITQMS